MWSEEERFALNRKTPVCKKTPAKQSNAKEATSSSTVMMVGTAK